MDNMPYYMFVDNHDCMLTIEYAAPFPGATEAKAYRNEVHPFCEVFVRVHED